MPLTAARDNVFKYMAAYGGHGKILFVVAYAVFRERCAKGYLG